MLTNLKIFFLAADANFFYGHKNIKIQDFNRPFLKWTFINVQNRFQKSLLGFKNLQFYIYYCF